MVGAGPAGLATAVPRSRTSLRRCLTCGPVGCCDDSPSRHATQHFHASAHPVIKSFEMSAP
ncbi:UBP-type zinc finger domain-containing protein [Corallococcus sp. CA049B]|uniref:UBP-type zinc finger domain-containing protein n=1 Tax=Corallococcus sp. CA049B TaxID=2316730 RepID=UPI00351A3EFA